MDGHPDPQLREGSPPLDRQEATRFRAITARLNYLAADRPDLKVVALAASRHMASPRAADWAILKRAARYLIGTPRAHLLYKWQADPKKLWVSSDSDWAGDPGTRLSTSGGAIWAGDHMIKAWSKTQHAIALSSMEAELYAAVLATIEANGARSLSEDLGSSMEVSLLVDSSAAEGLLKKEGLGKAKHIATQWLWVQQEVREGRLRILKVPGATNPADLMTKPLAAGTIATHLKNLGYHLVKT